MLGAISTVGGRLHIVRSCVVAGWTFVLVPNTHASVCTIDASAVADADVIQRYTVFAQRCCAPICRQWFAVFSRHNPCCRAPSHHLHACAAGLPHELASHAARLMALRELQLQIERQKGMQ